MQHWVFCAGLVWIPCGALIAYHTDQKRLVFIGRLPTSLVDLACASTPSSFSESWKVGGMFGWKGLVVSR